MIQEALIVGKQVLLMLIYIAIGIALVRTKMFDESFGKNLTNFLVTIVLPCVLISSFQRPVEGSYLNILLAFLLPVISLAVSSGVSFLFVRKKEGRPNLEIDRHGVIFSNSGFMGIPLIAAIIPDIGSYYTAIYIGVYNVVLWTLGSYVMGGKESISLKKVLLKPGVSGVIVGVLLHLLKIQLPSILSEATQNISALYTPLAMISTGMFLSSVSVKEVVLNKRIYFLSFLKLLVVPLAFIGLATLINVSGWFEGADKLLMANVVLTACPIAVSTVQLASFYNKNTAYASQLTAFSTIFALVTIPAMNYLTNFLGNL